MNALLKRAIPYFDQILVSGSSFFTIMICANKLALSEQGKLGYVFALYMATIVMQVTLIHNWATVQFPRRNNKERYLQSIILMSGTLTILSSIILCALMYWLAISASWAVTINTLILLFLFLVLQQATDFLRKAAYYAHEQTKALWISIMMYPLRIVSLVISPVVTIDDVLVIFIGSCVIPLIWFGKLFIIKNRYPIAQLSRIGLWHLKSSMQLGVMAVITWAWNQFPVFFLGALQGTAAVALLVSLRSLSNLFNVVLEVLETSFASSFAKAYAAAGNWKELIKKEYLSGLALWIVGLGSLILLHEVIVRFALGSNFIEYDYLIVLFWVSQGLTFLFRVEGVKLRTMGLANLVTLGSFFALAFISIVGWAVIGKYGVDGAAFLYICAPIIISIVQLIGYRSRVFR